MPHPTPPQTTPDLTDRGSLVMKTLAMPQDTNPNGDIFGGWLLSQMDLGGGILAKETARSRIITVAIFSMVFLEPVKVGDIVSCYAKLMGIGKTSMKIKVEAWVQHWVDNQELRVTEGIFTYVAIDKSGKPIPVLKPAPP